MTRPSPIAPISVSEPLPLPSPAAQDLASLRPTYRVVTVTTAEDGVAAANDFETELSRLPADRWQKIPCPRTYIDNPDALRGLYAAGIARRDGEVVLTAGKVVEVTQKPSRDPYQPEPTLLKINDGNGGDDFTVSLSRFSSLYVSGAGKITPASPTGNEIIDALPLGVQKHFLSMNDYSVARSNACSALRASASNTRWRALDPRDEIGSLSALIGKTMATVDADTKLTSIATFAGVITKFEYDKDSHLFAVVREISGNEHRIYPAYAGIWYLLNP